MLKIEIGWLLWWYQFWFVNGPTVNPTVVYCLQIWTLIHHSTQPSLIFSRGRVFHLKDIKEGLDYIALHLQYLPWNDQILHHFFIFRVVSFNFKTVSKPYCSTTPRKNLLLYVIFSITVGHHHQNGSICQKIFYTFVFSVSYCNILSTRTMYLFI